MTKPNEARQDRSRIDVNQEYELLDWTQKFGVSKEQVKAAVRAVGDKAADVERRLRGSKKRIKDRWLMASIKPMNTPGTRTYGATFPKRFSWSVPCTCPNARGSVNSRTSLPNEYGFAPLPGALGPRKTPAK